MYDLGPYVAAVNRLLFRAPPAVVHCVALSRSPEVDTSFSFLLAHEHGGAIVGHCGFTSAYRNRLSLVTPARTVQVDRVFSTPPAHACALHIRDGSGDTTVPVPAADAFAHFLQAFAEASKRRDFDAFEAAILADAELVERLRRAAMGNR